VNGDGIADIVHTNIIDSGPENAKEPIFVALANPDGTFRERIQLAHPRTVSLPAHVRVSDLDGDGHADLLVSDFQTTNLHFYRGDGLGNFAEGLAINAGGAVNAFDIGELNGDGHLDVVTANNDHTVSVLINRGRCQSPRRRAVRP
jgi:hypothetical protein